MTQTRRPGLEFLGLLVLSLATLGAEIAQIRVFSFTMNHAFSYLAISLALAGFALAGVMLSLSTGWRKIGARRGLALGLVIFGAGVIVTNAVFARYSYHIVTAHGLSLISKPALILLMFALPYFGSGLGIALGLLSEGGSFGKRYAVNLIGSGIGCLLVQPILPRVGGEVTILVFAVLACIAAALITEGASRKLCAVIAVASIACLFVPKTVLPFAFDADDQVAALRRAVEKDQGEDGKLDVEFTRWDPVGRIDIIEPSGRYGLLGGKAPARFFSQDAGAGSFLVSLNDQPDMQEAFSKGTLYGLATQLQKDADVLVIGVGGAPDIVAARLNGAKSVTGVDVNRGVLEAVGGEYFSFLGFDDGVHAKPEIVYGEGRGYTRLHEGEFDILQTTGADVFTAHFSGASMMTESHLYTIEAFDDLLRCLKPGGLLSMTRFGPEPLRVISTMTETLKRRGIEDPSKHIAVVGLAGGVTWFTVLVRLEPFEKAESEEIAAICRRASKYLPKLDLPLFSAIGFSFNQQPIAIYLPHISDPALLHAVPDPLKSLDLSPVTDDKPYFFQFQPIEDFSLSDLWEPRQLHLHYASLRTYLVIVLQVAILAALLIFVPLLFTWKRAGGLGGASGFILGFFGLGAGFMLLEIVLMQRWSQILGHPNHAVSTVLGTILVASGIGSRIFAPLTSRRPMTAITIAMIAVWAWVIVSTDKTPEIVASVLEADTTMQLLTAIAWLTPLGLFLGIPFPSAMAVLEKGAPDVAPWAWASNGLASVVASLAAVPLSMRFGLANTLLAGAGCYVVALIGLMIARRIRRGEA